MGLSDQYNYLILCEDKQTQCFMRSFLKGNGIPKHKINCCELPLKGCGEQYVRERYPEELEKLRATKYNRNVLFVCTDADDISVEERVKKLNDECVKYNVKKRCDDECVIFVIPKRNIETWIHFVIDGSELVDEDADYRHFSGKERINGRTGKTIAKMLEDKALEKTDLSSLKYLQVEYDRLKTITASEKRRMIR